MGIRGKGSEKFSDGKGERMNYKKNDLKYWYPKIKDIVPTPKTEIVGADDIEFIKMLDDKPVEGLKNFIDKMKIAINKIGGIPCFIRTGQTSGKHDWENTCYLADIKKLGKHIFKLVEFSFMADLFGLPVNTWVARELLPTKPLFKAFWGNMPITRELRLFVDNEKIMHRQPYWPAEAIEGYCKEKDWRDKIYEIQRFDNVDEMRKLEKMTIEINKSVPGYWSVDWLDTKNGWYMIDMAVGEDSYKWDCKIA